MPEIEEVEVTPSSKEKEEEPSKIEGGTEEAEEAGEASAEVDTPEKEYFNRISKDDVTGVTQLLNTGIGKVDMVDEHGMTPLQHAAYRGNKEMCQLLLDRVTIVIN